MKSVIITGGSRGIGKAIALAFAREGYRIFLSYLNSRDKAEEVKKEIDNMVGECHIFCCDVACPEQTKAFYEFVMGKTSAIDVLINNAGISASGLLADMSFENYSKLIGTNITGVYNMLHDVVPLLVRQHYGKIINISSVWGITGASCEAIYSASKSAVIGLTKAMAKELGPSQINVNAIAPGVIKTDMLACYTEDDLNALSEETPLMRLGAPEDVANLALFLASPEADFITGQTIAVDGGFAI